MRPGAPAAAASLKGRALRLLARRDYTRAELERKLTEALRRDAAEADAADTLRRSGASAGGGESVGTMSADEAAAQVARVLDELAAGGWLDDERAAEVHVTGRAARFGQRRLRQTLQQRGLPDDLVAAALAPLAASEVERARSIWRRRFAQPPRDAAERARQMRFLAGRGFDGDTIRRVITGADEAD
jgi:regulatory protein